MHYYHPLSDKNVTVVGHLDPIDHEDSLRITLMNCMRPASTARWSRTNGVGDKPFLGTERRKSNMLAEKPAYGQIAYTGNAWSVIFEPVRQENGSVSAYGHIEGYGKFPYEQFPDIPVIDLTGNYFAYVKAFGKDKPPSYKLGEIGLDDYLQWHIEREIPILMNRERWFWQIPASDLSKVECYVCGNVYYYDGWAGVYYTEDGKPTKFVEDEAVYDANIEICCEDCLKEWLESMEEYRRIGF